MRSAGCIVNDILDKEFDAKVFRTKNRPIASGKVSIKKADGLSEEEIEEGFALLCVGHALTSELKLSIE